MAVKVIPLDNSLPAFSFYTELDGDTYLFRFRWNGRISFWVFDIFTSLEEPIQTGNPFITGFELLRQNVSPLRPPGQFVVVNTKTLDANADRFTIGTDTQFVYVEAEA